MERFTIINCKWELIVKAWNKYSLIKILVTLNEILIINWKKHREHHWSK
jgi:hypothetical protein